MSEQQLLPVASGVNTWAMLGRYAMRIKRSLAFAIIGFIVASLFAVATPALIGALVDDVIAGKISAMPWAVLGLILITVILRALFNTLAAYEAQKVGTFVHQELGTDVMDAALNLNAQTIEDAGSGDLVNRVSNDLGQVQENVTSFLPSVVYGGIYLAVMFVSLLFISPAMAPVLLPVLIGVPILLRIILPKLAKRVLAATQITSELTTTVTENVRGLATIKELGIMADRENKFASQNEKLYRLERSVVSLRTLLWAITALLSNLPLLLALVWGYFAVTTGLATWGIVSTVALLVFSLRWQVEEFIWSLDRLREATAVLGRVCGVVELSVQQAAERTTNLESGLQAEADTWAIALNNVVYGYDVARPVIHNADLNLLPGESIALVGRSGSGKTTIARLIAGSLTANQGDILVYGHRVGNGLFPTAAAPDGRPRLLICTQEAHQFVGTVADNLTVVRPAATKEQMLAALNKVGAFWAEKLPYGLDTLLGSAGVELSRDQVQQLSLARIVLADPHAVILDESTTQLELLDAAQAVQSVMTGRTVIVISHDARIASLAKKAVLLQDGKIVAQGSPAEIFAQA